MASSVSQQAIVFDLIDYLKKFWSGLNRRRLFVLSLLAICIFGLWLGLRDIGRQPVGFDEGIILQAPVNMAEKNLYASFGAEYQGTDKPFDPFLSTGPTTTLPIAVVFKIFGTGIIQARLVMLSFYLTAIIVAVLYAYKHSRSRYSVLAGLAVLLTISSGINFRLDVLGEIPAVVYCLLSFIYWRHKRFFWSGMFAAFAVLSKFLMLIMVAAGLMIFAFLLIKRRQRKSVWQDALNYVGGAALPLFVWEVLRFIQTGGPKGYFLSVKEFVKFFIKNGSGIVENGTVLTMGAKFDMLLSNLAVSKSWLYIILGLLILVLVLHKKNPLLVLKNYSYPLIFLGLYLVWWLLLSNGAYTRYTVPLALLGFIVLTSAALESTFKSDKFFAKNLPLLLAVFVLVFNFYKVYWPLEPTRYPFSLTKQKQIAENIKRRKNYPLAHIGWWQNPEILFLTKLHSKDMHQFQFGEKYNLLLSPSMADIEPGTYDKGLKDCEKIWLNEERYILCEVTRKI